MSVQWQAQHHYQGHTFSPSDHTTADTPNIISAHDIFTTSEEGVQCPLITLSYEKGKYFFKLTAFFSLCFISQNWVRPIPGKWKLVEMIVVN